MGSCWTSRDRHIPRVGSKYIHVYAASLFMNDSFRNGTRLAGVVGLTCIICNKQNGTNQVDFANLNLLNLPWEFTPQVFGPQIAFCVVAYINSRIRAVPGE